LDDVWLHDLVACALGIRASRARLMLDTEGICSAGNTSAWRAFLAALPLPWHLPCACPGGQDRVRPRLGSLHPTARRLPVKAKHSVWRSAPLLFAPRQPWRGPPPGQ